MGNNSKIEPFLKDALLTFVTVAFVTVTNFNVIKVDNTIDRFYNILRSRFMRAITTCFWAVMKE